MLPPHIVGHIGSDSLRVDSVVSAAVFSHSLLKCEEHWISSEEAKGKSPVLQMLLLDMVLLFESWAVNVPIWFDCMVLARELIIRF